MQRKIHFLVAFVPVDRSALTEAPMALLRAFECFVLASSVDQLASASAGMRPIRCAHCPLNCEEHDENLLQRCALSGS